jgi:hypothetical protein
LLAGLKGRCGTVLNSREHHFEALVDQLPRFQNCMPARTREELAIRSTIYMLPP